MKKKKSINLLLIILLVALAAISFGPCIRDTVTYIIGIDEGMYYYEYQNYLPFFFSALTILEIALIVFCNSRWLCGLGAFIHVFKAAVPYWLYRYGVLEPFGGLTSHSYSLSWLGYILALLSLVILVFYMRDIIRKRPDSSADPV